MAQSTRGTFWCSYQDVLLLATYNPSEDVLRCFQREWSHRDLEWFSFWSGHPYQTKKQYQITNEKRDDFYLFAYEYHQGLDGLILSRWVNFVN